VPWGSGKSDAGLEGVPRVRLQRQQPGRRKSGVSQGGVWRYWGKSVVTYNTPQRVNIDMLRCSPVDDKIAPLCAAKVQDFLARLERRALWLFHTHPRDLGERRRCRILTPNQNHLKIQKYTYKRPTSPTLRLVSARCRGAPQRHRLTVLGFFRSLKRHPSQILLEYLEMTSNHGIIT
jgi:hypothetical protein